MTDILKNERFAAAYEQLGKVSLNPRRHTAPDARTHSDAVARMAVRLALANGCHPVEVALLTDLGHAHDIGKITGTAQPARSLDVLTDCGVSERTLLGLVKWHDTSLPWHRSTLRGEGPSDKAWRRLANEVDVRLLCLFMVADRVDAPGGWRRNAPTTWFLSEAKARGLVNDLVLDVEDHPSETCAGAALVMQDDGGPAVLVIRTRGDGWELPKGGIEWDELPNEAALRELGEETAASGSLDAVRELGQIEYFLGAGRERRLKKVRYYLVRAPGKPALGHLPKRTRERRWLRPQEVDDVPLVNESLRPLLRAALEDSGNG
ncbi:MAG TPA: NUDIX domain-containing protein [Polyangiaceae bacterium]|nr:NUDIX domain-containing protein [Polyangiaceae bacterium]